MYEHFISAGYKTHTDCIEDNADDRDRMATILVYLQDVEDGASPRTFQGAHAAGHV